MRSRTDVGGRDGNTHNGLRLTASPPLMRAPRIKTRKVVRSPTCALSSAVTPAAVCKKRLYVYCHHWTGNPGRCGEPCVREEQLTNGFISVLLEFAERILAWLADVVFESDGTDLAVHKGI